MKLPTEELRKLVVKKIEYGGVINTTTGKILKLQRGGKYSVETPGYRTSVPNKLITFHTHPSREGASLTDIANVISQRQPELIVNRAGIFLLRPVNKQRFINLVREHGIVRKQIVSWK